MQVLRVENDRKVLNISISEKNQALIGLSLLAIWNALIYYFGFVKPANIYNYFMYPYIDGWFLQRGGVPGLANIILIFAALGISYIIGWRLAKRLEGPSGWAILIVSTVVFGLIMMYMIPFASNDVYDNIIHGRIQSIYHANPFQQIPNNFVQDPFTWYAGWPNNTSAYGPLWELMAGITTKLVNSDGVVQNVLAFKALNGIFLFASIFVVAIILRKRSPKTALAGTLLLAWNPPLIFSTWGNAHNDIVMVFFMLFAVWAMTERRYEMAIVLLVAGALVKYIPLLLLPAAGLIALRELPNWKNRLRLVLVSGSMSIMMIVLAFAPYWVGPNTLTISRRSDLFTTSIPDILYLHMYKTLGANLAHKDISLVAAVLTFMFALFMAWHAFRDYSPDNFAIAGFSVLAFYILVTCLWYQPWYSVWMIAFIPLVQNVYARALGIVEGFAAMGKHFIFIPMFLWHASVPYPTSNILLDVSVHALPWLVALYGIWQTARHSQIRVSPQPAPSGVPFFRPQQKPIGSDLGIWVDWPVRAIEPLPDLQEQEKVTPFDGGD